MVAEPPPEEPELQAGVLGEKFDRDMELSDVPGELPEPE